MRTFASVLKKLRKEKGWTQRSLAKRLGVSTSAVANWEQGDRVPKADTLTEIASIFGVSVDEILGVADQKASDTTREDLSFIGKRLKAVRKQCGLNQRDVSTYLGTTPQHVSSYETGRTKIDLLTLSKLCELYDIDMESVVRSSAPDNDDQQSAFVLNLNWLIQTSEKTQKTIAEEIGVSPQVLNSWCKGVAFPRMDKLQALADYFNVSKADLIENDRVKDNDFGKLIRARRKEKGLTLEIVADAVGVTKSTVLKWENGLIANVRKDKIGPLAEILDIDPIALIGFVDASEKEQLSEEYQRLLVLLQTRPELRRIMDITSDLEDEALKKLADFLETFLTL